MSDNLVEEFNIQDAESETDSKLKSKKKGKNKDETLDVDWIKVGKSKEPNILWLENKKLISSNNWISD